MRPRVLLVGPMPPTKGGVTTFMLNLMASPLAAEVTFIPFTTSRPPKQNVTANWGYRAMLRGGPRRVVAGVLVTIWHLASFPFAVLRERADVVQIQASDYQVFWEAALYAAMARLLRRPVLFRIGGAFDLFWGNASWLERRLIAGVLRLPSAVIAQSAFARDVIRRAGRAGEIVLLPNWSHIEPAPARLESDAVATCLFIAGLEAKRKGVEEVLAAIQMLHRRGVAVRLHLVAATPALKQRVAALGLPGLTAEGPADHGRVLTLMRRHAIFLLPSHGEGFPNSLVEAMAAGMACIASPVGAVPEMADDGGVVLVAAGDHVALADAMARLAEIGAVRRELGHQAQRTVAMRYTARAALPGLAASYRRLAGCLALADSDVAVEAVR
jgi:glycosyltransferase involved in cell wall biosynthesis